MKQIFKMLEEAQAEKFKTNIEKMYLSDSIADIADNVYDSKLSPQQIERAMQIFHVDLKDKYGKDRFDTMMNSELIGDVPLSELKQAVAIDLLEELYKYYQYNMKVREATASVMGVDASSDLHHREMYLLNNAHKVMLKAHKKMVKLNAILNQVKTPEQLVMESELQSLSRKLYGRELTIIQLDEAVKSYNDYKIKNHFGRRFVTESLLNNLTSRDPKLDVKLLVDAFDTRMKDIPSRLDKCSHTFTLVEILNDTIGHNLKIKPFMEEVVDNLGTEVLQIYNLHKLNRLGDERVAGSVLNALANRLPPELGEHIGSFLTAQDTARLYQTSKAAQNLPTYDADVETPKFRR